MSSRAFEAKRTRRAVYPDMSVRQSVNELISTGVMEINGRRVNLKYYLEVIIK